MDWGLMQGIGDGLQQLGGSIYKAKYLDKLKEEEDVRKETRAQKRTDAQVVATRMIAGPDGVPVMQNYNAKDEPVGTWRLPTPQEIQKVEADKVKIDQDQQIRDMTIDEAVWKQGNRDADRALDIREKEASIESKLTSGRADVIRAQNSYRTGSGRGGGIDSSMTGPIDNETTAQALLTEHSELANSYTQGGAEAKLTRDIVERVARDVAAEQEKKAKAGVAIDVMATFRDALSIAASIQANKKK
jgi:hypothetical protein